MKGPVPSEIIEKSSSNREVSEKIAAAIVGNIIIGGGRMSETTATDDGSTVRACESATSVSSSSSDMLFSSSSSSSSSTSLVSHTYTNGSSQTAATTKDSTPRQSNGNVSPPDPISAVRLNQEVRERNTQMLVGFFAQTGQLIDEKLRDLKSMFVDALAAAASATSATSINAGQSSVVRHPLTRNNKFTRFQKKIHMSETSGRSSVFTNAPITSVTATATTTTTTTSSMPATESSDDTNTPTSTSSLTSIPVASSEPPR